MTWHKIEKPWHDTSVEYCDVCGNLLLGQYWSFTDGDGRELRACQEKDEPLYFRLAKDRGVVATRVEPATTGLDDGPLTRGQGGAVTAIGTELGTLFERAGRVIPGGVNSVNRVLPWPLVVTGAHGATFTTSDGKEFLDYHAAFGPLILGHTHRGVEAAVKRAIERLDLMGVGVTDLEVLLAEELNKLVPSAQRVLLTNSGSEATYAAIRVSRAVTQRKGLVKFQGTYHGWHDSVLMNVISPKEMLGQRDLGSAGMLPETVEQTIVLPFNDANAVEELLKDRAGEIAAVIVEVIPHNIGCVLPKAGFLESLRRLTTEYGVILIFDEVITGFRHGLGGYQAVAGVTPDLTTFAKAMANGYPIAALVGKAEIMDRFGPGGGVVFAGTYNGHPVGVSAALATIEELRDGSVHERCFRLAREAADGIGQIAEKLGVVMTVSRFGSVFVPYFMDGPIESYADLLRNDDSLDVWFRRSMCEEGVFMLPTALKRNHVSAAHTEADIERTLETTRRVLRKSPPSATAARSRPG